jgi:hypothetical protein
MEPIVYAAPIVGFFVGTLIVTRVGYWLVAIVTLVQQHRSSKSEEISSPSVGGLLAPVLFHSGPWLLTATLCWAYYVLSAPHAAGWPWFFGGVAATPILWLPVFWSFRRPRGASVPQAVSEMHDRAFFRFGRWLNVQSHYVLFCVFAAGIPTAMLLAALYYDAVKRAPELIVVLLGGSMIGAWAMSKVFWNITHPKPWRVPPSKQP